MASRPKTPRRRWSEAFKKRIIAEANQPGVSVAQVARRYGLDARRVSSWEKKLGSTTTLVPVQVAPDDNGLASTSQQSLTCVEIDFPCGTSVRCNADVSSVQLAAIITTLRSKR